MRRGRFLFLLGLVLILVVLVVYVMMQNLTPAPDVTGEVSTPIPTPVVDMVDVVIVTQPVERGQVISPEVLDLIPYQRDLLYEGMFTNKEAAVGLRARIDLEPGFVLTNNMVAAAGEMPAAPGSDWALEIPRGMVAVSIPASRLSAVSFAPQRGDHVNVIVSLLFVDLDTDFQSILPNLSAQVLGPTVTEEQTTLAAQALGGVGAVGRGELDLAFEQTFYVVPSERQRARLVSQSLIQDVIVLRVGTFPLEEETRIQPTRTPVPDGDEVAPEEETGQPTPTPTPVQPDVITLIVSPQDAVTLNYLIYSGAQITLALRGSQDDTRIQSEAVTLQYLLDQYNIPIPVKLPYGVEPRVDGLVPPSLRNDNIPTPVP